MFPCRADAGSGRPTTPPKQPIPYSPRPDDVIMDGVREFTVNLQSTFEIFLEENTQLPLWKAPLDLAEETRRHINGLKIPTISPSSQSPLLLLHNLGQPSHDAQLADRVDRLFCLGSR